MDNLKTSRIEARVSQPTRELCLRAASLQGLSLSDFVVDAVLEKAQRVVRDHEIIVLSEEASKAFFAALMAPPEPNDALRRAAERYREKFGEI